MTTITIFETGEIIQVSREDLGSVGEMIRSRRPGLTLIGPPFTEYQDKNEKNPEYFLEKHIFVFLGRELEKIPQEFQSELSSFTDPNNSFVRQEIQVLAARKSLEVVKRQFSCVEGMISYLWEIYVKSNEKLGEVKDPVIVQQNSHLKSLQSFPLIINQLRQIPLHPSLHEYLPHPSPDAPNEFPSLYDTIATHPLVPWIQKAEKCHQQIEVLIGQIEKSFGECRFLISDLQQSKQSLLTKIRFLEESNNTLQTHVTNLKELSLSSNHSSNSSNFSSTFNTPTSSFTSTLEEGAPSSQEMEESLSQIHHTCRLITELKITIDNSQDSLQREICDVMNKMRNLRRMIQQRGSTAINTLNSLLSKNNSHFECIKSIEKLPETYQDFLLEIQRRHLYSQQFSEFIERSQQLLNEMRNEEIQKREIYVSKSGRYLPPFFQGAVPSLRMKPSLTKKESLPIINPSFIFQTGTENHSGREEQKEEPEKIALVHLRNLLESEEGRSAILRDESLKNALRQLLENERSVEHEFVSSSGSFSSAITRKEIDEQIRVEENITSSVNQDNLADEGNQNVPNSLPDIILSETIKSEALDRVTELTESESITFPSPPVISPSTSTRYLYSLSDVAILWSIFVENLFILVDHNILPAVAPPSATQNMPPSSDWFVCVSTHEELESLHDHVRRHLVDIQTLVSSFLTAHLPFSKADMLMSDQAIFHQIMSDVVGHLHFSSAPILFWEDADYVPLSVQHLIIAQIEYFLFQSKIPLDEVSKVWKLSHKDILLFVEKGFLEYQIEDESGSLILEKSTGLSVFSPFPKKDKVESMGPFSRIIFGSESEDQEDKAPFFPSYTQTSLTLCSPQTNRKERRSNSPMSPLSSRPVSSRWCIPRVEMYTLPSQIQQTKLKSIQAMCSVFGFGDPSDFLDFLTTPPTTDVIQTIEWGVNSYFVTSDLTTYLLKWKLLSLRDILQMICIQFQLNDFAVTTLDLSTIREIILSMKMPTSSTTREVEERVKREFYPIIDWENEMYIFQSDSEEILDKLRNDQRLKTLLKGRK